MLPKNRADGAMLPRWNNPRLSLAPLPAPSLAISPCGKGKVRVMLIHATVLLCHAMQVLGTMSSAGLFTVLCHHAMPCYAVQTGGGDDAEYILQEQCTLDKGGKNDMLYAICYMLFHGCCAVICYVMLCRCRG